VAIAIAFAGDCLVTNSATATSTFLVEEFVDDAATRA